MKAFCVNLFSFLTATHTLLEECVENILGQKHPFAKLEYISRTLKSSLIIGVPTSEFSGSSETGGIKGEAKRGKGVREGAGPEGERGGKVEGKGVGGPKAHSKNSDFGILMI